MTRLLIVVALIVPTVAGCSLVSTNPVPPSPALAGVSAQNAAWQSQIERTPYGVVFQPVVDARAAVEAARAQKAVESYDAESLGQAEAALARAESGWQALAGKAQRAPDKLAAVANDAHRAQRLAEIARYTAVREINLEQVNRQMAARRGQPGSGANSAGTAGSAESLIGQRVIPDRLGDIAFESGTARLTASSQGVVRRLAAIMRDNPDYGVAIFGHTDNAAPGEQTLARFVQANPGLEEQAPSQADKVRAFNIALSSARARTVARTLVENGIKARRIGARGFGDTRPVASNDSAEGRRANRRIEAVIVPGPDSRAAAQSAQDAGS